MGQIDARRAAEGGVAVKGEGVALMQVSAAAGEGAEPEFWPLQVDQDADRATDLLLERANHRHSLAHARRARRDSC